MSQQLIALLFSAIVIATPSVWGAVSEKAQVQVVTAPLISPTTQQNANLKLKERLKSISLKNSQAQSQALIFDLPVTYNREVSKWVHFFQTKGQRWFREWLERSSRYLPFIQKELREENMPTDLAFMVMIESGFSATAVSSAQAVGPWQFIAATGNRYGLSKNWWLDERKDVEKSTQAAIRYMKDLYQEFGSWYLVAASYNMGEGGLRRKIQKHGTRDYWALIKKNALPLETQEYVPKILAAMLISKAPNLYGFRSLERREILTYDLVKVPGGTDLENLADKIGVTRKSLKDLNAEVLLGYIPRQISEHTIRVPKGSKYLVTEYISEKNQRLSRE
jgi:membrane-bound lytic murein transglycosylase D